MDNRFTRKIGFILRDGTYLPSSGEGHERTAMRYIIDHGLLQEANAYGRSDVDFLVQKLGAIRLAAALGEFYLEATRDTIIRYKSLVKEFEKNGYIVTYPEWERLGENMEYKERLYKHSCPYNQTIMFLKGKAYYNKWRDGD